MKEHFGRDDRLVVVARVKAAGGTLKDAAVELGMTVSGLSRFLTRIGAPFSAPTPRRFDYDAIFATAAGDETAYAIAKRIGGDQTDVRRAAAARGIALRTGSRPEGRVDWDKVLAAALDRRLGAQAVAREVGRNVTTVMAAAKVRGIRLHRARRGGHAIVTSDPL